MMGKGFSPRARGCSVGCTGMPVALSVFPACAGMFPDSEPLRIAPHGFPRVRGDVPGTGLYDNGGWLFSPRARGCSQVS